MNEQNIEEPVSTLEDVLKYKKMDPISHILNRTDMYVGSIRLEDQCIYVCEIVEEKWVIKKKNVRINPGLFKIFDEIVTNASDHVMRGGGVKEIRVSYNDGVFVVWNDGKGIPVQIHPDEQMYVPEMIFGNLHTGSNYNDDEDRYGGGRNGLGAKLTNVFSKEFIVSGADGTLHYEQIFKNNMREKTDPVIKTLKKNFTKIKFTPDYERFGLSVLDSDHISLFLRRLCDIAAFTGVKVFWNDVQIPIRNFKDYINLFLKEEEELFYEKLDDFWEIGIVYNEDQFEQFSLVNGINTVNGGNHVIYVVDKVVTEIRAILEKKNKNLKLRPTDIKSKMSVYLNFKIPNPEFSNQSKEALKSTHDRFPSKPEIPSRFIGKIMNSEIVQAIMDWIKAREMIEIGKLNRQQNKSSKVKVDKLDDAHYAGTDQSEKCSLILTEGDSAKTTALAGVQVVGRDYFGVFPLRGKAMNPREADTKKIAENKEISNIITALGLTPGKKYKDFKDLRYGKLIIMTDADVDGSHIAGLIINMISYFWPELIKLGFLQQFITPIVRVPKRQGKTLINKDFYNLDEYYEWIKTDEFKEYGRPRYLKGLGSIPSNEMKEFFTDIENHLLQLKWTEVFDDMINLAFSKNRREDRKVWLSDMAFDPSLDV